MARDIEVRGLEDLARLSVAFRAAGEQGKGMKRELSSSLNRETKRTRKEMRSAILSGLPRSGGLAADVQRRTRFTTVTRSSGQNIGVSIRARSSRSIRRMNFAGNVRHPVFGNRAAWVTQTAGVEKGFLDKPFERSRPALQRAVAQAIASIGAKIRRSL